MRNAHKTNNVVNYYYNNNNPNLTLAQGLGTFTNPNYYDKSYQLGPLSNYQSLIGLFVNNPGSFTFDSVHHAPAVRFAGLRRDRAYLRGLLDEYPRFRQIYAANGSEVRANGVRVMVRTR